MLRSKAVVGVLVVGLAVSGACAKRPEPQAEPIFDRLGEYPVTLSIKVSGDLVGKTEKRSVNANVVTLRNAGAEGKTNMFGIEPLDPMDAGGPAVIAGFAVQSFKGPGTYTIEPGSLADRAAAQQGETSETRSSIKVLWWPKAGDNETIFDYYRREKPCKVKVEKDGKNGRLTCPRLTDEGRQKHFSLEMRWVLPDPPPTTSSSIPVTSVPAT